MIELRGATCGAMTRLGTPCRRSDIYRSGRCRLHGGLSTGPTSEAGRARAIANLSKRWAARNPMGT
ncbi:HGGxSTG domain-containing protein [Sphingomonas beigongshangi]|uniref:HGGxSTG domain-containing protein n=1 Tax=Sphingomonas beigongshangi TaxID=2782540 RepID=UPI003B846C3C